MNDAEIKQALLHGDLNTLIFYLENLTLSEYDVTCILINLINKMKAQDETISSLVTTVNL